MANNGIEALLSYHALIGMSLPCFGFLISVLYIFLMSFSLWFLPSTFEPEPHVWIGKDCQRSPYKVHNLYGRAWYGWTYTDFIVISNFNFCVLLGTGSCWFGFWSGSLDASTTALNILDDNGNIWGCTLMVGNDDGLHFTIGGGWKRMVMARRLRQGSCIMLGAPVAGNNTTLYLRGIRIWS
jgi:hypothetical protein